MASQRTERVLRRRTGDRVLGGVAGGLGDYFNVDPLLIRIAFVGLMIFGGAGLVLYVVGWLLIPASGEEMSTAEDALRRLGLTPQRLAWIAFAFLAFVLVVPMGVVPLDNSGNIYIGPLPGMNSFALLAVAIIVVGIVVLRRREPSAHPAMTAEAAIPAQPATPAVKTPPRPRSPLAWYVVGALLLAVGLLAAISQVAEIEVAPGQFFGVALAVLGIGLVVGAWWGRARILILLAILMLPMGVTAAFVTAPLEGGVGDHRFTPTNLAELRDEYRLMGGQLILDLTDLSVGPHRYRISASVAVGQLVLILPPQASVELQASVGAGSTWILSSSEMGTSLEHRYVRHHLFGPTYILDLETGIGDVVVVDSRVNW